MAYKSAAVILNSPNKKLAVAISTGYGTTPTGTAEVPARLPAMSIIVEESIISYGQTEIEKKIIRNLRTERWQEK